MTEPEDHGPEFKFDYDKGDGRTLTGKQFNILARLKIQGSVKIDGFKEFFASSDNLDAVINSIVKNGYAELDRERKKLKITDKGMEMVRFRSTYIL